MKNVIITGGNGMIGHLLVQNCLANLTIQTVTVITRKSLGIQHPKLVEVLHHNFLDYTPIAHHFSNQQVCFYCIGVYTGQVPPNVFKQITVDFTKAFATMLHQHSPEASFCFLSGQGADSTEKSRVLFAREKGIAENFLLQLSFANTYIFRPGYIYPVTPRQEPNFAYQIMRLLYKPVAFLYPNIGVTSVQLAQAMLQVGLQGGRLNIYENKDIRDSVKRA